LVFIVVQNLVGIDAVYILSAIIYIYATQMRGISRVAVELSRAEVKSTISVISGSGHRGSTPMVAFDSQAMIT